MRVTIEMTQHKLDNIITVVDMEQYVKEGFKYLYIRKKEYTDLEKL